MNYEKIDPADVAHGEGIRVSLFVSGCPHHCEGCFNQKLWDYDAGEIITAETLKELLDACKPSQIAGLSLLGGEPLAPKNLIGVQTIVQAFKRCFPNKTVWCYTGYRWETICHLRIMKYIDVLVEGPNTPCLNLRGLSDHRIIMANPSRDRGRVMVSPKKKKQYSIER